MNPFIFIDPQSAAIVLFGVLIICLFVSAIFYFKAKHKEKLLLIEKGLTENPIPKSSGNSLQNLGIVIIAISIGIIIVNILNLREGIELAIICIMGGLGMIYANKLDKKS